MSSLTTPRGLLLQAEITQYLRVVTPVMEQQGTILCCSDIIESYFGKFKHKINPNSPNRMTEFVLTIANFGAAFDSEEIKEALEKVKCKDLSNWNKNDASLTRQKQRIFAKNATKKAP